MTCGVKTDAGCADLHLRCVAGGLETVWVQPVPNDGGRCLGRQIMRMSGACMIGMPMRDQRMCYRTPWVDIELTGGAVDALGSECQNHMPNVAGPARAARVAANIFLRSVRLRVFTRDRVE